MQERYLGDVHDFVKYALLRFLHDALGLRIGVNWYKSCPEDLGESYSDDGEQRYHLKNGEWEEWDSDLFKRILHFEHSAERRLDRIRVLGILPADTLYFEDIVPVEVKERCSWHQRARSIFTDTDLVFLDPDNGFQVKSMKPQKSPNYSFFQEAVDFLLMDKVVVGIQFARQCDPKEWGITRREQLHALAGNRDILPIVSGRVSPNILFLTLAPPQRVKQVRKAILDFSNCSPKFARDKRRAEIIT